MIKTYNEFLNESNIETKEHFVVLIKTHFSEGGYFIEPDDFEYKLIKTSGHWAESGSAEHTKLINTVKKLNTHNIVWVVWGDPKDTRSNIKKILSDKNTIEDWNKKSAKEALVLN